MKRFVAICGVFIFAVIHHAFATEVEAAQEVLERTQSEKTSGSFHAPKQDSICGISFISINFPPKSSAVSNPYSFALFFSGDQFVIQRTSMPPYIVGQNIPLDIVSFEAIGIDDLEPDTMDFSLNSALQSTGQITVDSVDSIGNLVGGTMLMDLYLNATFMDTIYLHNDDPLRLHTEFITMGDWSEILIDDFPGVEILYDSVQNPFLAIYSFFMNANWCSCCSGRVGDVNFDGSYLPNILDLNYLINYIFREGPSTPCAWEADINYDGTPQNILDLNFLVNYIFRMGPGPNFCPFY